MLSHDATGAQSSQYFNSELSILNRKFCGVHLAGMRRVPYVHTEDVFAGGPVVLAPSETQKRT